ncbi:MAG: hypothetical protein IPK71_01610 [Myxococcales bacterium]|nr:hypothetical protein [Myxococcales bacterium]
MRATIAGMSKDQVFRFRLDDEDRLRLDALAKHYSAPAATVVRILVNEKVRELGLDVAGEAKPPPRKRPPKSKK